MPEELHALLDPVLDEEASDEDLFLAKEERSKRTTLDKSEAERLEHAFGLWTEEKRVAMGLSERIEFQKFLELTLERPPRFPLLIKKAEVARIQKVQK